MKRVAEYEKKHGILVVVHEIPLYLTKKEEAEKHCLFFYAADMFAILESLITRSIMDGSFEDSLTFSSLTDKLVVVFGGDRGGESYSMLIRVANRAKGNTSKHCQLIALFENGAECYENLRNSVFSRSFPVRGFLQNLLDDKLVALVITVETGDARKQDSACVLIQISDLGKRDEFTRTPENVKFTLSIDDIDNDNGAALPEMDSRVPIQVPSDVGDEDLNLTLRLVRSSRPEVQSRGDSSLAVSKHYSVFCIEYNGERVRSQRWMQDGMIAVPSGGQVESRLTRLSGTHRTIRSKPFSLAESALRVVIVLVLVAYN